MQEDFQKIRVTYQPLITESEIESIHKIFGSENVLFNKYETKTLGFIIGGIYDSKFLIDFLGQPGISSFCADLCVLLIGTLFFSPKNNPSRDENRPTYRIITFRKRKVTITVSNTNPEGKLEISYQVSEKVIVNDYSDALLKTLLQEENSKE